MGDPNFNLTAVARMRRRGESSSNRMNAAAASTILLRD